MDKQRPVERAIDIPSVSKRIEARVAQNREYFNERWMRLFISDSETAVSRLMNIHMVNLCQMYNGPDLNFVEKLPIDRQIQSFRSLMGTVSLFYRYMDPDMKDISAEKAAAIIIKYRGEPLSIRHAMLGTIDSPDLFVRTATKLSQTEGHMDLEAQRQFIGRHAGNFPILREQIIGEDRLFRPGSVPGEFLTALALLRHDTNFGNGDNFVDSISPDFLDGVVKAAVEYRIYKKDEHPVKAGATLTRLFPERLHGQLAREVKSHEERLRQLRGEDGEDA